MMEVEYHNKTIMDSQDDIIPFWSGYLEWHDLNQSNDTNSMQQEFRAKCYFLVLREDLDYFKNKNLDAWPNYLRVRWMPNNIKEDLEMDISKQQTIVIDTQDNLLFDYMKSYVGFVDLPPTKFGFENLVIYYNSEKRCFVNVIPIDQVRVLKAINKWTQQRVTETQGPIICNSNNFISIEHHNQQPNNLQSTVFSMPFDKAGHSRQLSSASENIATDSNHTNTCNQEPSFLMSKNCDTSENFEQNQDFHKDNVKKVVSEINALKKKIVQLQKKIADDEKDRRKEAKGKENVTRIELEQLIEEMAQLQKKIADNEEKFRNKGSDNNVTELASDITQIKEQVTQLCKKISEEREERIKLQASMQKFFFTGVVHAYGGNLNDCVVPGTSGICDTHISTPQTPLTVPEPREPSQSCRIKTENPLLMPLGTDAIEVKEEPME